MVKAAKSFSRGDSLIPEEVEENQKRLNSSLENAQLHELLSESDTDRSLPAKDNFLKIPEPIEVKKEVSPPKIEVKTVKVEFHDEVNPFNFVIKEVKPEKLPEPPVELPEANDSFGF